MRPAQLLLHGIDGETKAERGEVSYPTGMKLGGKADLSFSIDFRLSITHETVRIKRKLICKLPGTLPNVPFSFLQKVSGWDHKHLSARLWVP